MRLIDADKLCNELATVCDDRYDRTVEWCIGILRQAPTVDAVDRELYEQCKFDKDIAEEQLKKIVRCKDCKHFTLNLIENVDGMPLIVAHEVCSFWGDGCKTSQEGFCSFGERKKND